MRAVTPLTGATQVVDSSFPPRTIHDETGAVVGVILAVGDYERFLNVLAERADWDDLPPYLQDAVDTFLADEAETEAGKPRPLREVIGAFGEGRSPAG